ncbi:hypothetical protein [Solitalea lacus]|uniref:hypothetical protein n=1 Tax=Solitalea lacus TaxID=2911172 RepID=UPI001EDA5523|nr:hypothetical protein [Solitalea lacus]UKJ08433.1 hypothetical protein L2B55_04490 [Solitalea lacus]
MEKQLNLIMALRQTAIEIEKAPKYQWGHMGSCNCGYLAQNLTGLTAAEIHISAMNRIGDWSEQLNDYCPQSGYPMDNLIFDLLQSGLSIEDLAHLERLSDPSVLRRINSGTQSLRFNVAKDVALYMNTWADMLEDRLLSKLDVQELTLLSITNPHSLYLH